MSFLYIQTVSKLKRRQGAIFYLRARFIMFKKAIKYSRFKLNLPNNSKIYFLSDLKPAYPYIMSSINSLYTQYPLIASNSNVPSTLTSCFYSSYFFMSVFDMFFFIDFSLDNFINVYNTLCLLSSFTL